MRNKEVDLCKLYDIVMRKGGSDKVTNTNAWRDVYNALNDVTNASTNVSYYTRLAYDKHLIGFEAFMKAHGANKTTPLTNACEEEWAHLRKTLTPREFDIRWAARKRKRGWREWGKHNGKKGTSPNKKSRKKKDDATSHTTANDGQSSPPPPPPQQQHLQNQNTTNTISSNHHESTADDAVAPAPLPSTTTKKSKKAKRQPTHYDEQNEGKFLILFLVIMFFFFLKGIYKKME